MRIQTFILCSLAAVASFTLKADHSYKNEALDKNNSSSHPNKLKITRDEFGMPYIQGGNLKELAESIGFVQGQDRLWQIFFVTQLANGRASQYLGSDFIDSDIFQCQINYTNKEVQKQIDNDFTPKTIDFYHSYVKGLNRVVAQVNADQSILPYELKTIGFGANNPVPKFTLYDILRTNQFILQQFSQSSIPNYQLDNLNDLYLLIENFGFKKAKEIFNDIDPTTYQIKSQYTIVPNQEDSSEDQPLEELHSPDIDAQSIQPQFSEISKKFSEKFKRIRNLHDKSGKPSLGSNGMVFSSKKSLSGNPMIRTAPQPNFNQPSDFYQIRFDHNELGTRGNFFTIPSLPFIMLGVFNDYGVALQVGHLPSNDFLFESMNNIDPKQTRSITIKVLGSPDTTLDVYRSKSGGWVLQMDPTSGMMLTLRSVFIGKQLRALNAFIEGAFAKNLDGFINSFLNPQFQSDIVLLEGQYVDSQNNIAAFHTGGWTSLPKKYDRRLPQGIEHTPVPSDHLYTYAKIARNPLLDMNSDQGYYAAWNSLFQQGAEGSDDTVSGMGLNRVYWFDKVIQEIRKLSFKDLKQLNLRQYVANSNTPYDNSDPDRDADLFTALFKKRFFKAVQNNPTPARLQAIAFLKDYKGAWFDGSLNNILNSTNISDKAILGSVWLNTVTSTIMNPFIAGTSREVAASTPSDPLPTYNVEGTTNSIVGPGNTLSRILKLAYNNKVFFDGWLTNQPPVDQIIVESLDHALDILGGFNARPWGKGQRGVYSFNNLILGSVQTMNIFNASGFYMIAEFTPKHIHMKSILALGESGQILGDPNQGNPQFNPHCFDQQSHYIQLQLRKNPPFIGNLSEGFYSISTIN